MEDGFSILRFGSLGNENYRFITVKPERGIKELKTKISGGLMFRFATALREKS